ncbi:MAG: diguanylate cyclase [Proteobacteria bacterium]|nr:diguanylate cyclase [Pseudomonadota bacterium]MBU1649064.1 diguanylate cyclase [Pseudomonadota bacterium]
MNGKTILIVDDSSTMRRIITRELEEAGYTVLAAENGMEALVMIEWMDKNPDLITLDIDMPVMNGFEVCERLLEKQKQRGDKQQTRIPIVFVSANDTLENRRRGFQLEVTDFISKPFKQNDIVKMVNKILFPQEQFPGMTALVIDDSFSVRRIISMILRRIGITVLNAANGLEGLKTIENFPGTLDLIITDYMMPEMRGDEFCKLIRQNPILDQVPLFVVSAFDDLDLLLSLFKSGATDYLHKPFIEEELLARVEIHLRARQYINQVEKLNKKLAHLASRDGLTTLYNRRYFQEALDREFTSAIRHHLELSCILIDLDFFKKINDSCGHAFGDLVLQEFATILSTRSRESDICARYGGEEFIVLLPHTNLESALLFAEEIRSSLELHVFKDTEHRRQISCSIGVASLQDHTPINEDKLVNMADKALYDAKKLGRNQVRRYSAEK